MYIPHYLIKQKKGSKHFPFLNSKVVGTYLKP